FFDENNRDVQKRRTQDGKWYLGKYYKILDTLSSHAARFLELPEMADLPKSLYPGEIARWFIYRNAPMDVRDILLTTFPAEFRPIDDACIHRMETDSPTRLAEVLPIISLQGNLRRIISTIDLLAGTSLKDKMAILAFTFWQEDPSRENIELASQLLNVGPREVYRYVDSIIDEDRLEQVWDRYIDLQENLEKANRQPSNVS
ncbi:MAG: hypothetical protein M1268_00565, partial [Patescibacteria group bacterium]|nr:hypothetical protein [Patescibacteria group bacterium]